MGRATWDLWEGGVLLQLRWWRVWARTRRLAALRLRSLAQVDDTYARWFFRRWRRWLWPRRRVCDLMKAMELCTLRAGLRVWQTW
eukprot:gene19094-20472_t